MRKPVLSKPEQAASKLKVLLHSPSGVGKTRLASTFPKPIIFDLEQGTSSITEEVPVIAMDQFREGGKFVPNRVLEYLDWLATPEGKDFETVVIDSLTEMQEQFLSVVMPTKNDPRQAYGEWNSFVRTMMTKLRALPKHFVVICRTKMGDTFEGTENMLLPQISPAAWSNVPALVDYAFFMSKKKEGIGPSAKIVPVLHTQSTTAWTKTRRPMPVEIVNPTFEKIQAALNG